MSKQDFSSESNLVYHFDVFSHMSHEAMLLFTVDGGLLRANRASYKLTGLAEDTPLHEHAQYFTQQLYCADGTPLTPDQYPHSRVAKGENLDAVRFEYNGTERRLLSCSGHLIGDNTHQSQAVLLAFRDITHEQQQEQIQLLTLAVAHHAAQFQALFSHIPDGVAFVDSVNHIMYVNEAGQHILGRPSMEKLEANADHYGVRELDGTPITAENLPLARALRGEQVIELEHIIEGAKGEIIRVSASANPVHGEDNSVIGAIAIFRDVTERRQREDEYRQRLYELEGLRKLAQATGLIRAEEAIYSTVVTQLAQVLQTEQCVVLTLDRQSEVFIARKPAYGIESDKLLHYDITTHVIEQLFEQSESDDVCIIDRRDAKINALSQTLLQTLDVVNVMLARIENRGEVIGCVMVTNSKDDHYFDISDMQLLQTVAPQIALAIINSRLYTQTQEAKQEAEQHAQRLVRVNAELDAFTYSVSHDLRAPLRAITGFSQLLERNLPDTSDRVQHQLSRIRVNVDKMSNLIDALLTFSRTGRQVPDQSRVDLREVVQETLRIYAPQIDECKARIQIDNLPLVIGDYRLLEVVFANLIGNSIKYRRPETQLNILVRGAQEATTATVIVQDNGIGFDSRYQDKIFQVFQRLHKDNEYEGTGIGLSLVRKIVEAHRGHIWAEGQPGVGTTFYIELPLYPMPK